jgi:hypothetical protein
MIPGTSAPAQIYSGTAADRRGHAERPPGSGPPGSQDRRGQVWLGNRRGHPLAQPGTAGVKSGFTSFPETIFESLPGRQNLARTMGDDSAHSPDPLS